MSTTGSILPNSAMGTTKAPASSSNRTSLNANDFIQLMVTQLRNQDPTDPMKSSDLLAQVSQIGQLQSSTQLQGVLTGLVAQGQIGSAGNLIGKTVQGVDDNSKPVAGVVDSVRVSQNQIYLELHSGQELQFSKVTNISNAAPAGSTTTAATTAA